MLLAQSKNNTTTIMSSSNNPLENLIIKVGVKNGESEWICPRVVGTKCAPADGLIRCGPRKSLNSLGRRNLIFWMRLLFVWLGLNYYYFD